MIKALIFDVFGTVVDWRSGIARETKAFMDDHGVQGIEPESFADAWRAQYQPSMARIRGGRRGYVALDQLHYENLLVVLKEFELEDRFTEADLRSFARAWEKLTAWPDASPGLYRLKRAFAIAPCSNGSIALMTWLAKYADLPWDCILGAEIAKNYKPKHAVYQRSAEALGLEPDEVMMVAAHNDDLIAARDAGLPTAFVPRPAEHGPGQSSDLEPASNWNIIAKDFNDLADQLSGA